MRADDQGFWQLKSRAVMMGIEEGHFRLEGPIDGYTPELANRQVLRPDAKSPADTQPAARHRSDLVPAVKLKAIRKP